jgi:asparagine synthase (glutamine-hydrolysing)
VDAVALAEPRRLATWAGVFDAPALARLLAAPVDAAALASSVEEAVRAAGPASPLSRALYVNARTYLLDDLLPKMDRMAMAHGLETRSPFLDRPLAEYAASLPDALKRRRLTGKVVLRRAVADLVPAEVLRRPKHGFAVPLAAWFRGELQPMLRDTLLGDARVTRRLLRRAVVGDLVRAHAEGRADHGHRLWTLLTLELWMRRHGFE